MPVPVPAVVELAIGWRVSAGGPGDVGALGELATPTGMALVRTLAAECVDLPTMTVEAVGVGAGGRDRVGRANVVRVIVGSARAAGPTRNARPQETAGPAEEAGPQEAAGPHADRGPRAEAALLLEANVDDLDPRLWPGVLAGLMAAGAADAWLVPILMKKGRPAHTLSVLCAPELAERLRGYIFASTSTLGVRESARVKTPLDRRFVPVRVPGGRVAVKVGSRGGVILQVTPEFEDVAAVSRQSGRPERVVLQEAQVAAAEAGLVAGAAVPGAQEQAGTAAPGTHEQARTAAPGTREQAGAAVADAHEQATPGHVASS
ncbi:hypothetical protein ADL15_27365 [Actinoplanes awajinensis subsp. mycoplanecinus]|uniref:LarC family nickel insertion protein n=1 Tax=Actinoplanes awajinensis subsp. mycoplanecinus TaxID=135947 RepID=A0A101JMJ3_9ACTN|nr:hypothetical protein ADL15_27365 [Actinoplanes awajinensis subsp. mycoplanecinus]